MKNLTTSRDDVRFRIESLDVWNARTNEAHKGYVLTRYDGNQGWMVGKFATMDAANAVKVLLEQNRKYELSVGCDIR